MAAVRAAVAVVWDPVWEVVAAAATVKVVAAAPVPGEQTRARVVAWRQTWVVAREGWEEAGSAGDS